MIRIGGFHGDLVGLGFNLLVGGLGGLEFWILNFEFWMKEERFFVSSFRI
jgi:hypothetical protein